MYRFYINKVTNDYHYNEIIKEFLSEDEFETIILNMDDTSNLALKSISYLIDATGDSDRDKIKRQLYRLLSELTGIYPEWGTLTGVRPLKLAMDYFDKTASLGVVKDIMMKEYLLSDGKASLLNEILEYQTNSISKPDPSKYSIYIGIPFCPTRCSYCSFASNVAPESEIALYLDNLITEIKYTGQLFRDNNTTVESIYIGGGTPTTLNAEQLERLISVTLEAFNVDSSLIEFTVEAGRPDTITTEKLVAIRDLGIDRISINPQSMKQETLDIIGRSHTPDDIAHAFDIAREVGFKIINSDLIAGLQGESIDDFVNTLERVIELGANNVTVHTLSIKRGSRMKNEDPEYYRRNTQLVSDMLDTAHSILGQKGFIPYYIYRQKHQIGSLENVGYCKKDLHSVYNIRIMEDKQTIVALGAGAIGKVYFPEEDRLERVANVSNYKIYNERFEDILERKHQYFGGRDGN